MKTSVCTETSSSMFAKRSPTLSRQILSFHLLWNRLLLLALERLPTRLLLRGFLRKGENRCPNERFKAISSFLPDESNRAPCRRLHLSIETETYRLHLESGD